MKLNELDFYDFYYYDIPLIMCTFHKDYVSINTILFERSVKRNPPVFNCGHILSSLILHYIKEDDNQELNNLYQVQKHWDNFF